MFNDITLPDAIEPIIQHIQSVLPKLRAVAETSNNERDLMYAMNVGKGMQAMAKAVGRRDLEVDLSWIAEHAARRWALTEWPRRKPRRKAKRKPPSTPAKECTHDR